LIYGFIIRRIFSAIVFKIVKAMYANAVTVMLNKRAGRPITPNKKDKIVKVTIASAASIPPTTRIVVAITTTAIGIQMGAKSSTAIPGVIVCKLLLNAYPSSHRKDAPISGRKTVIILYRCNFLDKINCHSSE
jgi:hypothetical protein